MRIVYMRPDTGETSENFKGREPFDGGLSVLGPHKSKAEVERSLGRVMTDEEYDKDYWKGVPDYAINPRAIPDEEVPGLEHPHRVHFRDAWVDVTPALKIDICHKKAKAVHLTKLRKHRSKLLQQADIDHINAIASGDHKLILHISEYKQHLRDITNPLKTLAVDGHNDPTTLEHIKQLGSLDYHINGEQK